jgi:hypothetical protein
MPDSAFAIDRFFPLFIKIVSQGRYAVIADYNNPF